MKSEHSHELGKQLISNALKNITSEVGAPSAKRIFNMAKKFGTNILPHITTGVMRLAEVTQAAYNAFTPIAGAAVGGLARAVQNRQPPLIPRIIRQNGPLFTPAQRMRILLAANLPRANAVNNRLFIHPMKRYWRAQGKKGDLHQPQKQWSSTQSALTGIGSIATTALATALVKKAFDAREEL